MVFLRISLLCLLFSCANEMLKKSPPLAKNKKIYFLDQKILGRIYGRDCKNKRSSRECQENPSYDLLKEWSYFSNGFILVPYDLVFPVPRGN